MAERSPSKPDHPNPLPGQVFCTGPAGESSNLANASHSRFAEIDVVPFDCCCVVGPTVYNRDMSSTELAGIFNAKTCNLQVHALGCLALNRVNGRSKILVSTDVLADEIADLTERGDKVTYCKCCKGAAK